MAGSVLGSLFEGLEAGLDLRLSGLYFVLDPTRPTARLLDVLEAALRGGVDVVQVWSGGRGGEPLLGRAGGIRKLTRRFGVPLIINNDIALAKRVGADGVHLDECIRRPGEIRRKLGRQSLVGYTMGNTMEKVRWAEREGADYISFCSMYPSSSVIECEIVPLATLRKARRITKMPIFASGGINLSNAKEILEAGADGIAVISAIQGAEDPEKAAREFKQLIRTVSEGMQETLAV